MAITTMDVLRALLAAYPKQNITAETVKIYGAALSDINPALLQAAVLQHITASKWFPTIAEIRQAAIALVGAGDEASAYDAWRHVKQFQISDPIAQRAIDALGGMDAFRRSDVDEEPSWRMRFIQAYRSYQQREVDEAVMLPAVAAARAALAPGVVRSEISDLAQRLRLGSGPINEDERRRELAEGAKSL